VSTLDVSTITTLRVAIAWGLLPQTPTRGLAAPWTPATGGRCTPPDPPAGGSPISPVVTVRGAPLNTLGISGFCKTPSRVNHLLRARVKPCAYELLLPDYTFEAARR